MCDLKHLTEPDAARSWFRMQDAAEFGQSGNAAEEESPRRAAWPGASKAQLLRTRYMDMLLHVDEIPRLYNMLAAFFTWILLAGFIVFPGTYTTLEHNVVVKQAANGTSYLEEEVVETAMSISVLWVAGVCCAVGASGTGWLWIKWRKNYVWVVNRIFLTGLFNSAAGFLGTMVNVYTVRKGHYSTTAKVTAIVTGEEGGIKGKLGAGALQTVHRREASIPRFDSTGST
ncbi:hypothetical protein MMC20_002066 [Loxospora ochrophaea]|nr:hypothetical protein [Loxospora ochrophaea]